MISTLNQIPVFLAQDSFGLWLSLSGRAGFAGFGVDDSPIQWLEVMFQLDQTRKLNISQSGLLLNYEVFA